MSKGATNFIHALVAVLAGNAIYFLLERYLPPAARHEPFRMDLGMVVDFWFCLVVFGTIKTIAGRRRDSDRRKD
jgi:hypothetical protein